MEVLEEHFQSRLQRQSSYDFGAGYRKGNNGVLRYVAASCQKARIIPDEDINGQSSYGCHWQSCPVSLPRHIAANSG